MIRNHALSVSPRTSSAGFTLTEIVISVGVVATAFVAIVGLLPAGMDASRKAADSTVTAAVLEDVSNRLKGQLLPQDKNGAPIAGTLTAAYFDDHGVFLDSSDTSTYSRRLYRADVKIGVWNSSNQPTGTSGLLRPISIQLSWPVNSSGTVIGKNNPQIVVSYLATPLTGSNWAAVDSPSYVFTPQFEY